MRDDIFIYVGPNAGDSLIEYCQKNNLTKLMLVADDNTYAAAGRRLAEKLTASGFDVKTSLLKGQEIVTDEHYFVQVLLDTGREKRTFISVGSGTITDITRFVSFHTHTGFIAFPTAASVDGFTGAGAPSVLAGFKKTVMCHSPMAVFGDLAVLSAAPQKMIASGFGDMLAKYTALADWRLGQLFWHEPYDEAISRRIQVAANRCVAQTEAIGQASQEGIQALMDGLIEAGLCMLDDRSSRPASGIEHQIAHHLEMKLLWEHRPAVLHGAKVGACTIITAGIYDRLRRMSREEAMRQLTQARPPSPAQYRQEIEQAYPLITEQVLDQQADFISLPAEAYAGLKQKIADHWADIQDIAASVPSPQQMAGWLKQAGGETDLEVLGFTATEVGQAVRNAHLLRGRFTASKLWHLVGLKLD